ncbi:MAG: HAD family hydrolase [Desulfosarcina sp.]|nr:HAD family hydrolase [Desulfobacterales bacterium]
MKKMRNIKVVAFDCDGVMFDTINTNRAYYNHILENFGRPEMTQEELEYVHIHTADKSIARLFDDTESFKAAINYCKQLSYIPFLKYMDIEPYLKMLLEKLRKNYKTAIATNRTTTMDSVLSKNNLEDLFDIVVTALDVEHPKPYPDSLISILKYFKLKPENLIYIGDSTLDEQAAKAAGVFFVAYDNTSIPADFHIKSLKDMESIIEI